MNGQGSPLKSETAALHTLQHRIHYLLFRLEDDDAGTQADRHRLYKMIFAVALSVKEADDNLREIKRDLGPVAYHLQIDPAWLGELLGLVDALIAHMDGEHGEAALCDFENLDAELLINASHRYRLARCASA